MSIQAQSLERNSTFDWKEKYYQELQEFEAKEKLWSKQEGGLYKSILRLILSHGGLDEELDQQLSSMRDKLRKVSNSTERGNIIDPIIEAVLRFAQQRDDGQTQSDSSTVYLDNLLDKLVLPDKYNGQIKKIQKALAREEKSRDIDSCIDQLCSLIDQASKEEQAKTGGIELKADDPLTQLLENLSLPGEPGIEIISLRKRAGEIEEEQERLQIIQDLVQVLSRQSREIGNDEAGNEGFPHFKETLLELFEWLSIPSEYNTQVKSLKSRITRLEDDSDLSVILRDTAIIVNDLQAALQVELSDVQHFLAKITSRLGQVENCFRDLADTETESREETQQLNSDIKNNVRNIREGITEDKDIKEIKQSIENRLLFIEQSVETYFQSTQERQHVWVKKVDSLKQQLDSMKGESIKLHKRIQEEYKKAKTDALTNIPNRLAYNEKIKQEFIRWQRNAKPLSVCVIDVDKFKNVNDTFGHKAGDKVLRTIAEVCAAKIRKMDFIARYGGEEFVLLLPETPLDMAMKVADNLRREIEVCKFHYARKPVAITISCGLAELREGDDTESVFVRADKALYTAKERGRNRVIDETQI